MSITKKDFIEEIQSSLGCTTKEATTLFENIVNELKDTLIAGKDIKCVNFGSFHLQHREQRMGRNPQTGQQLVIKSSVNASFHASSCINQKLNKNDDWM